MDKNLDNFYDAIENGASKDELLDIVEYMNNPDDLYEVMMEVSGDHPDDVEIYNAANRKYKRLTGRSGSRKGAQAFATGNFNKGLNGVLGTINAGAQKVGKKMKKDKSRKGLSVSNRVSSGDCFDHELAGLGSRPEDLKEIATKITLGRNRSIGEPTVVEDEPTTEAPETKEEQTREGGFLRSIGKVVTNGAKVVGNGIHAAADELTAGGKDALNDTSTDFDNVSSKIKNTPGGTSDEAAEKAGTPAGAQEGTQSAGQQDIASRVMNGEFGNGEARTKALTDAGYDPQEVQAQVNSRLNK